MSSKFFLLGSWQSNTGPTNVNKTFVENNDGSMSYIHSSGKFAKLERLKFLLYTKIVVSGGISSFELLFCKLLKKKLIYLMHGCGRYESEINQLGLPASFFEQEDRTLRAACVIACVSYKYSKWVSKRYPQFANKITYLNNGLSLKPRPVLQKEPFSIAVSGGNRIQKKNGVVCKAVGLLRSQGYNCKIYAFGREYPNNEDVYSYEYVKKMGHLDMEEYYAALDKISLYVINSTVESFGLVVGDALNCNCSLLMSDGVGAASIMATEECDIVKDCDNVDEVAAKILYLLEHGNSKRLFDSIDKDEVSEKSAYMNLKRLVDNA